MQASYVVFTFLISTTALALQLAFTRILSVLFWQHLVYAIVTISLLGFAMSGTALQLFSRLRTMKTASFVQFCFSGFAGTSLLAVAAVNSHHLFLSYLASTFPFFFFGLFVLGMFQRYPEKTGMLYAANLLGSAAGSLLYLLTISAFGALGLIQICVFFPCALVAFSYAEERLPRTMTLFLLFSLLLTAKLDLSPDRTKQFWTLVADKTVELTRWNPISRVDVIRANQSLHRHLLIDGDAQALMVPPADRVLADVKFQWQHPGSDSLLFPTKEWKELSVLLHLEPVKTEKTMVVHLETAGARFSQTLTLPIDHKIPVLLSWSAKKRVSRISIDYNPFRLSEVNNLSFGPRSKIWIGGSTGRIVDARVWDKVLDLAELMTISSPHTGYERLIGHGLFQLQNRRPENHVLVIGNGGGADSVAAIRDGAGQITAVEVNPTTYALTKNYFAEYYGHFFNRRNVNLVLEDGRSFVRRSKEAYDRIALVGVDSFAAANSGAYVLAENYLYTIESLADYWDHLSPEGLLQISRWHFPKGPRETFRVFTMAYEMLARRGVPHPERFISVVTSDRAEEANVTFATVVVSKRALKDTSLKFLREGFAGYHFKVLYHPLFISSNVFFDYVSAASSGRAESYYRTYPFDVRPVTDDNPFFFHYGKLSRLFTGTDQDTGTSLIAFLLLQCLLAGFAIVLPTWLLLSREERAHSRSCHYFAFIGIGFMLVEMYCLQKFVLVLGHPMYSLGITLPALLGSAAVGSLISSRWKIDRAFLFGGIAFLLALLNRAVPLLLNWALPFPFVGRIILCLVLIFPIGVALGVPFPTGLRAIRPSLIPLAWAVNGAFTVFTSVAAIAMAMHFGFSSLLWMAAGSYLLAGYFLPHTSHADDRNSHVLAQKTEKLPPRLEIAAQAS